MNPFAHPEMRDPRGRSLSGEPAGRAIPSPIAVAQTGRNRSRRHPILGRRAGGSVPFGPSVSVRAMAGWQARRHVCPRARSGASVPVLNPPHLAGGFALPATFKTLHDRHRSVSELRPCHPPRIALLTACCRDPSRQTGVCRCAKSSCTGAK